MALNYIDYLAALVEAELDPERQPDAHAQQLYRLYALLVLTTGEESTLQNVHDAWSTWMTGQQPDHPALVPFEELRADQQEQDRPYLDAILRAARAYRR